MRLVYRRVRRHPSGESWSLHAVVRCSHADIDLLDYHPRSVFLGKLFACARVAPVPKDVEPGQAFAFEPDWSVSGPSAVAGATLIAVRQRGGYDV